MTGVAAGTATITATVKKEYLDAYEGEGPVLYVEKITTTSKPEQEVVTF